MDIALRAAVPADDAFLRHLHETTHCAAFSSIGLAPGAHAALLRLQFDTQRAQYRAQNPGAVDLIIVADGEPVGRCRTGETPGELRLMDLAVAPDRQRSGVAGAVLDLLLDRARAVRLPLRLSVWSENAPALALYRSRGLHDAVPESTGGDEARSAAAPVGYRELEWLPTPARTS